MVMNSANSSFSIFLGRVLFVHGGHAWQVFQIVKDFFSFWQRCFTPPNILLKRLRLQARGTWGKSHPLSGCPRLWRSQRFTLAALESGWIYHVPASVSSALLGSFLQFYQADYHLT